MHTRTAALLGVICLAIGWVVASVLSPPVATTQPRSARVQPQPRIDAPAPFTERLQTRLQEAPPPPDTGRNPFLFGRRAPVPDSGARLVLNFTPTEPAPPAAEDAGPRLSLTGVATTQAETGVTRTAVLSDGRDVYLVAPGDPIGGYTVERVDETTVVLVDAAGRKATLRLP
ncbi:MAG: hypothetical protein AB1635_06720 [Acidobacteriota bacterium]